MDGWISRFLVSIVLYSGALLPSQTFGIGDTHLCSSPLGMESGEIPDSALSASSYYVKNVGPDRGRLNRETQGGAWCPKEPISIGIREWLQVSLNETHLISGVQMQGRYSNGLGQEYTEEFQLEYWREGFSSWRKYYRFDGKTVFPGNTDTSTVVTTKLRPPLFAQKVRFLPYAAHRRVVCLRVELVGCVWQGGVMQYSMEQGDIFSEGISLRDEFYDGQGSKWDRRVEVDQSSGADNNNENSVNIFHRHELPYSDSSSSGGNSTLGETSSSSSSDGDELDVNHPRELLTGGLGQLTDKIEGANSFTMDIGFGLGNGWVGWRRRSDEKDWVEVLFEFDEVRRFSYIDVFTNNYPSKGVQYFSRARVYFSIGGIHFTSRPTTYIPASADVTLEQTRNLTIPLEQRIARFLKIHLFYRGPWIVVGEIYFNSEIYDGNYTEELGPDAQVDFPDTQAPLEIGDLDSSMVETVVGIISGLILLLGIVAGLIICMRRNGRSISSAFQFHTGAFHFPWRTTWSSVPTHIVTQTNPTTEGVKDLLLTLTPLSNGGVGSNGNGGGHHGHHHNHNHHHHHLNHNHHHLQHLGTGNSDLHGGLNNTTVLVNGDFKVHNNLQHAPPSYSSNGGSAVVLSGVATVGKNSNGLKLQGSHYNNYGTKKKPFVAGGLSSNESSKGGLVVDSSNSNIVSTTGNNTSSVGGSSSGGGGTSVSNNPNNGGPHALGHRNPSSSSGSPTKLTLRSNQLAALEEAEDYQHGDGALAPDDDNIYQEASTLTINNSTLRTKNRKMKIASSVWNLGAGGGRSYRNHRGRLVPEVSLRQLRLIENLGSCVHGQVHLYEFEGEIACHEGTLYRNCRLIAKTIKNVAEIRLLSVLDHEHVLEVIAVCSEMKKPILALYPAPECGDLCSFLSRLSNTPSLSWLLSVGAQIASGMNYLESLSLVHRDLAARNCLVEREGSIRISDLAMACEQYRDDYCHTATGLAPLRWWSWESILTTEFTMQSSVWSFGVTLWEILTLCRQKPLAHISDHQLTTLAEKYGSMATSQQVWLPQPLLSPPEIFDLMRECWQKNPEDRPTFQHIHLFLEQKCNTTIYHAV